MKLTDQVPQLKYCQRIAELGVNKPTIFQWLRYPHSRQGMPNEWEIYYGSQPKGNHLWVAAPTVAELGEMLPFKIEIADKNYYLIIEKNAPGKGWEMVYQYREDSIASIRVPKGMLISEVSLADGMAQMLIYLLEHSLI